MNGKVFPGRCNQIEVCNGHATDGKEEISDLCGEIEGRQTIFSPW